MLPTNGLTWGKTGRGADDVSNLLLYNSRPLTVLVLGELDRTFLSAWNGGPSAHVGIVIRPLLPEDCIHAREILKGFSTSSRGNCF